MRKFYWKWIQIAFSRPLGIADYIAGAIGIVSAYIIPRYPQWEPAMSELAWQIPLGIFSALAAFRLLLSPYWMYKEAQQKIKDLEVKFVQATSEKEKLQSKSFATPDELTASHLRGLTIRIADLTRESTTIRGKVFEKCYIYGPAIIMIPNTIINGCSFDGSEEDTLIVTTNERVMGVIILNGCTLRECHLLRIGLIGNSEQIQKAKQGFIRSDN